MVNFYIIQIKLGKITLADVPVKWREEVEVKMMLLDSENME